MVTGDTAVIVKSQTTLAVKLGKRGCEDSLPRNLYDAHIQVSRIP